VSARDVLESIIEQARTGPDLPAVKDLTRALNYAELIDQTSRLATGLRSAGVAEGDRVALLLPNSVDFIVAALACLWVGAAFIPLAVSDPDIRLTSIAQDCQPVIVITSEESGGDDEHPALFERYPRARFDELLGDHDPSVAATYDASRLAYAIYTSGTTGTPKGVVVDRAAFANAVVATSNALGLSRATRTLCVSPFHFDGSFATFFPTLFSGGAVVIRPRDALLFARTFFNAVIDEGITYTGFSPSYLRLLLDSPQIAQLSASQLDVIALGGEASSVVDVRTLQSFAPRVRIFNRYGPTETTIAVTHVHLTPELLEAGVVPIGVPHPGVAFYLIDTEGVVIEGADRSGELYIGGSQLMVGYWGAPELTQSALRSDVVPGQTVYRTGDFITRNSDGNYWFVGRTDNVVKRAGVRISLIEINDAIRSLDHVVAATCLAFDDGGQLGIIAFVVVDSPTDALELRRATRRRLPDTMLPDRFELVESLPMTSSSKTDERALLAEAGLRPFRIAELPQ
jgi:D-alanine--poly(phosphoribitol) ligase subunit 1